MICSWRTIKSSQRRGDGSSPSLVSATDAGSSLNQHSNNTCFRTWLHPRYNLQYVFYCFKCLLDYFLVVVALSYSVQIIEEGAIPVTPFDIPVDALVSPAGFTPISTAALRRYDWAKLSLLWYNMSFIYLEAGIYRKWSMASIKKWLCLNGNMQVLFHFAYYRKRIQLDGYALTQILVVVIAEWTIVWIRVFFMLSLEGQVYAITELCCCWKH